MGEVQTLTAARINEKVQLARADKDGRRDRRTDESGCSRSRSRSTMPSRSRCSTTRGLQARYQELGIAEADLVQVGRLPNPGIAFARKTRAAKSKRAGCSNLTTDCHARSWKSSRVALRDPGPCVVEMLARRRYAKVYLNALAAEETVRYMRQVMQAAEPAPNWLDAWNRSAISASCSAREQVSTPMRR